MQTIEHQKSGKRFATGRPVVSYCVDANVFITAWNLTYPKSIFPTLYREMEEKLPDHIILIKPVFDEIEPVSGKKDPQKLREQHPVRTWLKKDVGISETPVDDSVKQKALELMGKYETDEHSKGAGETDITLITYASLHTHTIVTFEAEQNQQPAKKSNYKIPLICQEERVECINFVELLTRCKIKV